jgi:hypothetical protein
MPLQGLQVHVQFFEENCDELRKVTNTGPPFTVPIDNLAVASAQLWRMEVSSPAGKFVYLGAVLPEFFMYLKNSEVGSRTSMSPLFLKLCL